MDEPAAADHRRELEHLARQVRACTCTSSSSSDDAFDRWIVAADTVVLPYRHIWSSSVAERAALYGRPVIATRVGGLADQLGGVVGATLVADNAELASAMPRGCDRPPANTGPRGDVDVRWPGRSQRGARRGTTTSGGRPRRAARPAPAAGERGQFAEVARLRLCGACAPFRYRPQYRLGPGSAW